MSHFIMPCPACRKNLTATEEHLGKKVKCAACGAVVVVSKPPSDSSDRPLLFAAELANPQSRRAWSQRSRQSNSALVVLAALLGLVAGYFAGREHLKYEISSTLRSAGEEFSKGMTGVFGDPKQTRPAAAAEAVKTFEIGATHKCSTVELTLDSASIEEMPIKEGFESRGNDSDDPLLLLQFTIRNPSDRLLLKPGLDDGFSLKDDMTNSVRHMQLGYGDSRALIGVLDAQEEIPPGESRSHILMFKRPLPKTKLLLLTVDSGTFESDGKVAFRIPVDKIKGF